MNTITLAAAVMLVLGSAVPGRSAPGPKSPAGLPYAESNPNLLTRITQDRPLIGALMLGAVLTSWASRYDQRGLSAAHGGGLWDTDIIDIGDVYGEGFHIAWMSALTWTAGSVIQHPAIRQTGEKLLVGFALNGALVTSVKLTAGRLRPDGSDTRSFPSGHTSTAFTVSTILARRHGWWVGIPAFAAAGITAASRMEDNKHYASDVVAGAFLGILVGKLVASEGRGISSSFTPYAGKSGAGVKLRF